MASRVFLTKIIKGCIGNTKSINLNLGVIRDFSNKHFIHTKFDCARRFSNNFNFNLPGTIYDPFIREKIQSRKETTQTFFPLFEDENYNHPNSMYPQQEQQQQHSQQQQNQQLPQQIFNRSIESINNEINTEEQDRLKSRKKNYRFKEKNTVPQDFVQLRKFFWQSNRDDTVKKSPYGMRHTFDFRKRPNLDTVKLITGDLLPLSDYLKNQIKFEGGKSDNNH